MDASSAIGAATHRDRAAVNCERRSNARSRKRLLRHKIRKVMRAIGGRQYFGTLGSTSLDQAIIPPVKFDKLPVYPLRCKASIARALRPPILQCTTVSRLGSISDM